MSLKYRDGTQLRVIACRCSYCTSKNPELYQPGAGGTCRKNRIGITFVARTGGFPEPDNYDPQNPDWSYGGPGGYGYHDSEVEPLILEAMTPEPIKSLESLYRRYPNA